MARGLGQQQWHASAVVAVLAACGGGGATDSPHATDVPENAGAAARFLTRASFGPTREAIDELRRIGYAQWFHVQQEAEPSLTRPKLTALRKEGANVDQQHRIDLWWKHAVTGEDQLRQRVAWALSQIFVISDRSDSIVNDVMGMSEFYDILVRNALGSYRQLLEQVTLNPAMGTYLSMLHNQKADPAENLRPDENYAREVLQLFSIGLVELNADGTPVLDGFGKTIPTYDQEVVEALAADFTGWSWAGLKDFWEWNPSWQPMENWGKYHDKKPKAILSGVVLPGGQSGEEDLAQALDVIAAHENVGPFLGKQLIQRFVTSNPTPEYVARISAVWDDDGQGERGNLFAVIRAILTDPEAREGHATDPASFGKVKEPLLRLTALWRAFDGRSANGKYRVWGSEEFFGQAPLRAPSVFNFYSPFFSPPGVLGAAGLVAPEMQITTHSLITSTTNDLFYRITWAHVGNQQLADYEVAIDTASLERFADDVPALVAELDVLLVGGLLSPEAKQILIEYLEGMKNEGHARLREAIYMIATSPEAAVQR